MPSPAVVAVSVERGAVPLRVERDARRRRSGLLAVWAVRVDDSPEMPPHESGSVTVRVTSTVTWRGFGALVRNTTEPRYSPGARLGSPIVSVTSWLAPAAIAPEVGLSDSHGTIGEEARADAEREVLPELDAVGDAVSVEVRAVLAVEEALEGGVLARWR